MKYPISDQLVAQYASKVRRGEPTNDLFPARMSDCEFSPTQREIIRKARADRKAAQNNGKLQTVTSATPLKPTPSKSLSKLGRLLYLQSGRCFFCGEPLRNEDASIEHLTPKSRGGTNTDGNLVACHKSLNQVFGDMDLKGKFEFVINAAGKFKCPKT